MIYIFKIIDVSKKTKNKIFIINKNIDKKIVATEIIIGHTVIYNIDINLKDIERISLSQKFDRISDANTNDNIFAISINKDNTMASLNFYRVLSYGKEIVYICSIILPKEHYLIKEPYLLEADCFFFSINSKYALLGYPAYKCGGIILIDAEEKKTYHVNTKISDDDNLSRLDTCSFRTLNYENKQYVVLKTGEVGPSEKLHLFKENEKNNEYATYLDHIESLIFFDMESIEKNTNEYSVNINSTLIEKIGIFKSIDIVGFREGKLVYNLLDFKKKVGMLKEYDFKTKTSKILKKHKPYDQYLCFENIIYGILYESNTHFKIYNIIEYKCIFEYIAKEHAGMRIKYIDSNYIVIQATNFKTLNFDVLIYNINNSIIIEHYKDCVANFYNEIDTLLIYNG